MAKYKAYFDRRWDDINGYFTIQDATGHKVFERLPSRSGQPGWTDTSWERGKSPIPYGNFSLWLKPYSIGMRAGSTGIGEFFPIGNDGPYHLRSLNGQNQRTAIGLHEENSYDGSAGCIVIVSDTDKTEHLMLECFKFLKDLGESQETIPIEVL